MRLAALALACLLSSCALFTAQGAREALDTATNTANALNRASEKAEAVLTDTCQAAELGAVTGADTPEGADAAVSAIQTKCHAAWAAYEALQRTFKELAYSLESARGTLDEPSMANVMALLAKLTQEEHDFAAMVTALLHEYG